MYVITIEIDEDDPDYLEAIINMLEATLGLQSRDFFITSKEKGK